MTLQLAQFSGLVQFHRANLLGFGSFCAHGSTMKCLTRLLCVLGLLLSVAFADSFDETRKKAEQGYAGHFGGFIRQFDSHPIFLP